MKKLLLLTSILIMTISFVACGGVSGDPADSSSVVTESVNMVNVTTSNNLTLKLPDTMTMESDYIYADTTVGDSASFTVDMADESFPLSDWTQQDFMDFQFDGYTNLVVSSFDNNL